MRNKTGLTKFRGKRVLLMGLGLHGGGVGAAKFLLKNGARLTITDLRSQKELAPSLKELEKFKIPQNPLYKKGNKSPSIPLYKRGKAGGFGSSYGTLRYVLGKHRESDILSADLIVKGPAVKPNSPFIALAKKEKIPITSEMALFFRLSPAKIIGVTGTRGKSTAAYLIWKFLKTKFRGGIYLGGNIRKSALEFLPKLKREDWVVLELSSFQLDDLAKSDFTRSQRKSLAPNRGEAPAGSEARSSERRLDFKSGRPEIAVITNILRDHLNWHGSMASYVKAKGHIFTYQNPADYLFINPRDPRVRALAKKAKSRVVAARLPKTLGQLVDKNLGKHYRQSAALACAVARHFGVLPPSIKKVLADFRGLEGRQERIAEIRGVTLINDTTATIPEAAIAAVKRFYPLAKKRGGKVILIAGGADKKLDFRKMVSVIRKYAGALVLLPGTATGKLNRELAKCHPGVRPKSDRRISGDSSLALRMTVREVNSMHDAVKIAYKLAQKGDYVILSPGAASFGLFLNEFDRGEQFVKAVKALRNTKNYEITKS